MTTRNLPWVDIRGDPGTQPPWLPSPFLMSLLSLFFLTSGKSGREMEQAREGCAGGCSWGFNMALGKRTYAFAWFKLEYSGIRDAELTEARKAFFSLLSIQCYSLKLFSFVYSYALIISQQGLWE